MEIKQKFNYVDGSFETDTGKLVCVKSEKYCSVELCFKENMYIPFAKIKLHSKDRYIDAKEVLDDAYNLGKEICKRWNAYESKQKS